MQIVNNPNPDPWVVRDRTEVDRSTQKPSKHARMDTWMDYYTPIAVYKSQRKRISCSWDFCKPTAEVWKTINRRYDHGTFRVFLYKCEHGTIMESSDMYY